MINQPICGSWKIIWWLPWQYHLDILMSRTPGLKARRHFVGMILMATILGMGWIIEPVGSQCSLLNLSMCCLSSRCNTWGPGLLGRFSALLPFYISPLSISSHGSYLQAQPLHGEVYGIHMACRSSPSSVRAPSYPSSETVRIGGAPSGELWKEETSPGSQEDWTKVLRPESCLDRFRELCWRLGPDSGRAWRSARGERLCGNWSKIILYYAKFCQKLSELVCSTV